MREGDDDSNLHLILQVSQHRKTEPPQKIKMEAYMYIYVNIVMCV